MNQPGIEKLLKKGKKEFRIPENLDYYSEFDFKEAERKYLRLCVIGGQCPHPTNDNSETIKSAV